MEISISVMGLCTRKVHKGLSTIQHPDILYHSNQRIQMFRLFKLWPN
jgi:hypothetical protein